MVAVPATSMTTQDKTVFGSIFLSVDLKLCFLSYWNAPPSCSVPCGGRPCSSLSFWQLQTILLTDFWWWTSKGQITAFFWESTSTWCKTILTWSKIRLQHCRLQRWLFQENYGNNMFLGNIGLTANLAVWPYYGFVIFKHIHTVWKVDLGSKSKT